MVEPWIWTLQTSSRSWPNDHVFAWHAAAGVQWQTVGVLSPREPRSGWKGKFPIFEQCQSHQSWWARIALNLSILIGEFSHKNFNGGIHTHAYQPHPLFPPHALCFGLSAKRKNKCCQRTWEHPECFNTSTGKPSLACPFFPFILGFAAGSLRDLNLRAPGQEVVIPWSEREKEKVEQEI